MEIKTRYRNYQIDFGMKLPTRNYNYNRYFKMQTRFNGAKDSRFGIVLAILNIDPLFRYDYLESGPRIIIICFLP